MSAFIVSSKNILQSELQTLQCRHWSVHSVMAFRATSKDFQKRKVQIFDCLRGYSKETIPWQKHITYCRKQSPCLAIKNLNHPQDWCHSFLNQMLVDPLQHINSRDHISRPRGGDSLHFFLFDMSVLCRKFSNKENFIFAALALFHPFLKRKLHSFLAIDLLHFFYRHDLQTINRLIHCQAESCDIGKSEISYSPLSPFKEFLLSI